MTGLDWATRAACRAADPNVFFPDEDSRRGSGRPLATEAARRYCAGCPVLAECRDYGNRKRPIGVWGGVVRWHKGTGIRARDLLAAS